MTTKIIASVLSGLAAMIVYKAGLWLGLDQHASMLGAIVTTITAWSIRNDT